MKKDTKELYKKIILFGALVLLTIWSNVINLEAAMLANQVSPLNAIVSLAVILSWIIFLVSANLFVLTQKQNSILSIFLFSILILIPISYIMSLTLFLHALAGVLMWIPLVVFIIPLAGLIIPTTELIARTLDFDFLTFGVSMLFVLLLLVFHKTLSYKKFNIEQ